MSTVPNLPQIVCSENTCELGRKHTHAHTLTNCTCCRPASSKIDVSTERRVRAHTRRGSIRVAGTAHNTFACGCLCGAPFPTSSILGEMCRHTAWNNNHPPPNAITNTVRVQWSRQTVRQSFAESTHIVRRNCFIRNTN